MSRRVLGLVFEHFPCSLFVGFVSVGCGPNAPTERRGYNENVQTQRRGYCRSWMNDLLRFFPRGIGVLLSVSMLSCLTAGELLTVPATLSVEERTVAMPKLASSELGKILNRYYRHGLGGRASWEQLKSLRLIGQIQRGDQSYALEEWIKKPDLWKQELRGETFQKLRGYDGKFSWKQSDLSEPAKVLDGVWSECYAMDLHLGSLLLYPYAEGKRIELIESVPLEGKIGHRIRVSCEGRPIVFEYTIEVPGYLESSRVVLTEDGERRVLYKVEFQNYQQTELGVPIPHKRLYYRDDELVSSVQLDTVRENTGLMPWMFRKPE